jgi:hypothetical protein
MQLPKIIRTKPVRTPSAGSNPTVPPSTSRSPKFSEPKSASICALIRDNLREPLLFPTIREKPFLRDPRETPPLFQTPAPTISRQPATLQRRIEHRTSNIKTRTTYTTQKRQARETSRR